MDSIRVRNLIASARVGVGSAERERPQPLGIDLELWGPFSRAAAGDRLADTVDYADAAAWICQSCAAGEWRLLECLAEELAAGLLARYPALAGVGLTLRKRTLQAADCVEYTIRRRRPSSAAGDARGG